MPIAVELSSDRKPYDRSSAVVSKQLSDAGERRASRPGVINHDEFASGYLVRVSDVVVMRLDFSTARPIGSALSDNREVPRE